MKNFKFKSIIFSLLILLSICSFFIFAQTVSPEEVRTSASYTKGNTIIKNTESVSNEFMYTGEEGGSIPFSLFISTKQESQYAITNYIPTFTETTETDSAKSIYYYTMEESSRPYLLLSSNSDGSALYNSTVFFKFNDSDGKTNKDPTINNQAGYLGIDATVNGIPIVVERSTTNATTNDTSVVFSVNLQRLVSIDANGDPIPNDSARCPTTDGINFLGGNGADNQVSYRTGLYEFKIRYSYTDNVSVSNECVLTISFYILNYEDYVPATQASPYIFTNTDTCYMEGIDTNHELYNYNYTSAPIVEIDATKFGMNFVYTSGYVNNFMQYNQFNYIHTPEKIKTDPTIKNGDITGTVVVKLKDTNLAYSINTYKRENGYYIAKFDTADFEKNFLIPNNISTTFQGTYSFDLQFLVQEPTGYKSIDKTLIENIPEKISNQKLVIFGYQLKYFDQDPNSPTYKQDVTLERKGVTHTNFISYNDATADKPEIGIDASGNETGYLIDIPEYIAITDQAPLRFHSYGNLKGTTQYTSKFLIYDYKTTSEQEIIDMFNAVKLGADRNAKTTKLNEIKSNIDTNGATYNQGASISGDNIRIMKLEYSLSIVVTTGENPGNKTINGCQYIVFEINNTVQNLYIQAVDGNTSYDFDTYTNKNVRVNLEQKPNTFFAPVNITYSYSSNFVREDVSTAAVLYSKKDVDENGNITKNDLLYTINNKNYNYFVTAQTNNYTFSVSGYYKVSIRSVISNVPKVYSFIIDKTDFTDIKVSQAVYKPEVASYVKSATTLSTSLLTTGNSDYIKYDLYVTSEGFTLEWQEKLSKAASYSYVYYMETVSDSNNQNSSLFKTNNNQYWLTNGLKIANLSSAIDNYQNSLNVVANSETGSKLLPTQYFNKDGIYFFYVYDQAGNFFTRVVLIDSSLSSSLQGYWEGNEEDSNWVNTFDPVNNPANYVNKDTTIYFGSHKAIRMNMTEDVQIEFEDISFTRAYDLADNGKLKDTKPPISFAFYADVLSYLKNYLKSTNAQALIGSAPTGTYLTLENTSLYYKKAPTTVDLETEQVEEATEGTVSEIYKAKIYTTGDTSSYNFNGEADYTFRITNQNNKVSSKIISMNFDMVQGTFYAYGSAEGDIEEHLIRKNSATNLEKLKFEYNILSDSTAKFYTLKSLTYDFYEFVVDDSNENVSNTSYPFAKQATKQGEDLLSSQFMDEEEKHYIIDPINISPSDETVAGKYVLTRTYVGGTHEYIGGDLSDPNSYEEVEEGGSYYYDDETHAFINLFELDSLVRKYIIYVDHNGIITSVYMIRDDGKNNVREVGDNISISLSHNLDDNWNFKEFFLTTSGTLTLDTNKVPVRINIPLSKYFVYYNTVSDNLYSKLNFAKLEISVFYAKNIYSEWIEYKIDGFDPSSGLCTCSKLISNKNPLGELIFSAAGNYKIVINDRTGYTDATSNAENADNLFPTTYTYTFDISHTAPYTNVYTYTYNSQKDDFEEIKLTNEDGSNNFATNIKKENNGKANNQVYTLWNDPITPYNAKVNKIDIEVIDKNNTKSNIAIDLKQLNLHAIASSGTKEVDLSQFANSNFIIYLKVNFFEDDDEAKIYDNVEYFRYSYTLSIDITQEYIYNITLSYVSDSDDNQSYIDDKGNSYADSLYKVTIDRTKPYTNINSLMVSEEFLQSIYSGINTQDFKEENFNVENLQTLPSTFTYTFGLNDTFKLTYDKNDTASYFYVRNYNKYEDQYISITPDMVDTVYEENKSYYTDFSTFSINYPRFAEIGLNNNIISINNYVWYKIDYSSNESLYSLIGKATNQVKPVGFYEIIEKDLAGNYRCYTIYFTEFTKDTNYLILEIDGYNEQGYSKVDNDSDNNITASLMFELTELKTKFGWGKATITNETMSANFGATINFTPFDDNATIRNRLDSLNEFFKCDFDSRFSITLNKYNSAFPSITRYINIITNESTAKLSAPSIEEVVNASDNTITYNLKFPTYTSKSVLYLEKLSVYVLNGKVWSQLGTTYEGKESIPERILGLQKGIYKVTYNDNYNKNSSYSYILYVGEYYINNFNNEYKFEYSNYLYDSESNSYYSGGNIDVTYEANIYTVWVNGIQISGNEELEKPSTKFGDYNCKTFTLTKDYLYDNIEANQAVGGRTEYQVIYRDITDNSIQKTFTFVIFNALPNIQLTNSFGNEAKSTLEESSAFINQSIVSVSWGEITACEFDELNDSKDNIVTSATLYTKNQNGEYKNGVIISKGQTITEEGYYKVELKNNKLGNYREIYFVIQFGDLPLYSVIVDKKEIFPSTLENFNLVNSQAKFETSKPNDTLVNIIHTALSNLTLNSEERKSLNNHMGYRDGSDTFNPADVGICQLDKIPHYYTIGDAEIIYSSNIELNIIEFKFKNNILQGFYKVGSDKNPITTPANVGSDYWTTIYLVYNFDNSKMEFFAITKTPKTTALITETISFLNEKTNSTATILLSKDATTYTLTNAEIKNSDITLAWNKLSTSVVSWYNQGNIIYVSDKYGVSEEYDKLDCSDYSLKTNHLTSTITGSGKHELIFKDWAGNTHEFASNTYAPQNYYTLYLIDSVIYHLNYNDNDYNSIQYGVFNDNLTLVIDAEYLNNYYDLKIVVNRNGNLYNKYIHEEKSNLYHFNESGRYTVQISANYGTEKQRLNDVKYNFTIINSNSARLAYEFVEMPGYEITEVIRNNEDITNAFVDNEGKIKSLFISYSDSKSGNGYYTITLKYGKKATDKLTYSFSINDYVPTITSNVAHGETTTGSIVIGYNPSTIYEQLGETYIKVLTYNSDSKTFYEYSTITINEDSFVDNSAKSFEITRSNSYFIQVQTKNGNTISSFRVNKKDPLNTIAIIIIVVAVIAVVVLIIVVVKLRTKMKVR
ncbi:MAG: hypothetical protein IJB10_02400 [Clostridia bacterium]|nr:hypothetical protein [Clostridia bacterium]